MRTSHTKRFKETEGATLILVVLFTLLLLMGILAASLRLGLNSRQTTADQAATLQAQYAAESGISLVKSRLQDVQAVLSSKNALDGSYNFNVPGTTTLPVIKNYAENFCGKSGASAWEDTHEFSQARNADDVTPYPAAQQCTIDSGSSFTANQSSILADYLTLNAYNSLPSTERPTPLSSSTARLTWWNNLLSQTDQTVGNAKYKIRPVRVVQLSPTNYRFYIRALDVRAQGTQGTAARVLAANPTASSSDWWFEIVLPSLLTDVLMTNHHRSKPTGTYDPAGAPAINFDDQIFDGSIHSNEKFLFTSTSSAQFMDKVSSVGCTNLPQVGLPTGGDCTKTPGVYIGSTQYNPPAGPVNRDKWVADTITASPRTVQFAKTGIPPTTDYTKTDFTADYKPLPINANDQQAAASSSGLTLNSDTRGVELVAGGSDGNALTTYDSNTKKWQEPNPMYQYIRYLKPEAGQDCQWSAGYYYSDYQKTRGGRFYPDDDWNSTPPDHRYTNGSRYSRQRETCTTVTNSVVDLNNQYRFGPDKILYKKIGNSWISQNKVFNGVVYGDSFQTVRGPDRKDGNQENGDVSNAPPAVASFAGLTIASNNDIKIDSDLTVSDTPCSFADTKATPPCTKRPKNILGIYAQSGDVILSTATGNDLNIHASIMSSEGQVTAENYGTRPIQGNVKLIGSLIENWYGAFGKVSGVGYGRDFTYDQRLKEGVIPPFFPVSPLWKATNAAVSNTTMSNMLISQASKSTF